MPKVLRINDSGYVWEVPAEVIAKNRAMFYADRDKDTTYDAEFEFAMGDDYELKDWFLGNMDWEDVEKEAQFVASPGALARPRMNGDDTETRVVTKFPQATTTPENSDGV